MEVSPYRPVICYGLTSLPFECHNFITLLLNTSSTRLAPPLLYDKVKRNIPCLIYLALLEYKYNALYFKANSIFSPAGLDMRVGDTINLL